MAFKPVFQSFRNIIGTPVASVAFAHAEQEQAMHLEEICRPDTPDRILVVLVGDVIVAFCASHSDIHTKIGEIGLNAVHPDYQGQGIGTLMYRHVLHEMKRLGMTVATVGTGGDPSHAPARRAYQKAGFGPSIPSLHLYRLLTNAGG